MKGNDFFTKVMAKDIFMVCASRVERHFQMTNLLSTSIDLYINKLGYDHLKIFIVISHQIHYTVTRFSGLMVPRIISNFDRTR